LTEDEIAAVHEAAHAAFALLGKWTKLAGPVMLRGPGCGDVVMSTDVEAIRRSVEADPGFDRDLPRIELVRALLAGPIAERMLAERKRTALGEEDLGDFSENDYATVAQQLAELDPPRPGLRHRLEREIRQRLEEPALWSAIERFAAILIERRRLEAEEATAILGPMLAPRSGRAVSGWRAALEGLRRAFSGGSRAARNE
jgi:hypothetical protein